MKKLPFALALLAPLGASALEQVHVVGRAAPPPSPLQADAGATNRLGLTLMEIPAAVEIIDTELLQRRGARSLDEALRGAVGVAPGGNPGSPSQLSARGFTSGFVSPLYDGMRVAVPTMSARTQDSFNLERIEILKGPASVMAGDGAIGGAVNFVTKRPDRANPGVQTLLSYGSFDTWRAGADLNTALGEASAARVVYSHQRSAGYVERNRQRYDNLSLAFTSALTPDLTFDASVDLLRDDILAYQGTPLVPRAVALEPTGVVSDSRGLVLDRSLTRRNFNTDDAQMEADSRWTRARLGWRVAPGWTLRGELSHYTADRLWRNAESQVYAAPRRIVRDLVGVSHDHQVRTARVDLTGKAHWGAMAHRLAVGAEYVLTDFATQRRFSNGSASTNAALTVDLPGGAPGSYASLSSDPALYAGAGNRSDFTARIPTASLFLEDAVTLAERWTLVAGLRRDRIKVERANLDLNTGARAAFGQTWQPGSARLGLVYAPDAATALYAQVAEAAAPVGSGNLLLLSAANAAFALSKATQREAGIKQSLMDGRLHYSAAIYRISLDNILTRDAALPTLTVNSGAQSSRGIELAAAWRATRRLDLNANVALVDARYDSLLEAGGVSRAGNTPPNVPRRLANLWLDYKVGALPLHVGAAYLYTGARYTGSANTTRMAGYGTADLHATWSLRQCSINLRIRNINDTLYTSWSGANANNQVIIGSPRAIEITYRTDFGHIVK